MKKIIEWSSILVAALVAYWVKIEPIYQALLVFIVLDVVSGSILAYTRKTVSAQSAYTGIFKKGGELVLIGMAAYLQIVIPGLEGVPLPQALAGFYCYVEGLSIIENAAALGVPIPQFLRDALVKLSPDKDIPPGEERRASMMKG